MNINNIYQFMSDSPWLTFFISYFIAQCIEQPFLLIKQWIEHRNIVVSGWPPGHLDAGGNFKKENKE